MLFDTGRRVVSGLGRPRLRPPLEVPGRAPPRPPGKQPAVATEAPVVIALVRVIAQVIKIVSVISVRTVGTGRRSRCRSTGRRIKNHRGGIVLLVGVLLYSHYMIIIMEQCLLPPRQPLRSDPVLDDEQDPVEERARACSP